MAMLDAARYQKCRVSSRPYDGCGDLPVAPSSPAAQLREELTYLVHSLRKSPHCPVEQACFSVVMLDSPGEAYTRRCGIILPPFTYLLNENRMFVLKKTKK